MARYAAVGCRRGCPVSRGKGASRSSPIKRRRRTKPEMAHLREALIELVGEDPPMSVRQVFYLAVFRALIAKTEAEYKSTIVRLLTELRLSHDIPFSHIADNTRWMRKPDTHASMADALRDTARFFCRDLWSSQDAYVEI